MTGNLEGSAPYLSIGVLVTETEAITRSNNDMEASSFRFSILTPTYNRAHTLPRLYASLEKQNFCNLEWIIVDDGSVDGTKEVVAKLAAVSHFPIRYLYQDNNHKKSAVNKCVSFARGELSIIVDSDDELEDDALKNFWYHWQSLPMASRERLAGMRALCRDNQGNIVGSKFPANKMESTPAELQHKYRVKGEKISCERTEILRLFPFKEDVAGFVIEGTVWNEIGKYHNSLCLNFVARIYHFESESLSNMTVSQDMINKCEGLSYSYAKMLDDNIRWFFYAPTSLTKMAINWSRFTLHARLTGQQYFHPKAFFSRLLGCMLFPIGWIRYQIDTRRANLER